MSVRQGNKVIAGHINYRPDLFDYKWADHMLNDVSWLRADTFSWQDGGVYKAAYQHLGSDIFNLFYGWENDNIIYYSLSQTPSVGDQIYTINSFGQAVAGYQVSAVGNNTITIFSTVSGVSVGECLRDSTTDNYFPRWISDAPQTETVAGITIEFYLAPDGHKIVLADQESNVASIYNATGVAWYYILDTTNQRFKLPRTKFGFTGIRSGVGNYVEAGSPNITGTFYRNAFIGSSGASQNSISGAFTSTNANGYHAGGGGLDNSAGVVTLDASRSSPIYGNSNTVQPKATEMYLYFYVGNFTQTALENTAGVVTEDFNELNAHKVIAFQAPNAGNNYTWYRKYADGWVEQGGKVPGATSASAINFPVTMADSNYYINGHVFGNTDTNGNWIKFGTLTTTGTTYVTGYGANNMWAMNSTWEVKGIAA